MKKLLLLILVSFVANLRCDDLSDAIRESNVAKVRSILDQGKITFGEGNKYLVIAEEALHLRRQQLLLGSPTAKSLPSTSKIFWIATTLGATYFVFFMKNGIGYSNAYEYGFFKALRKATEVWVGIGCATAATHWYRKKIQILEDNYHGAALIYELVYDLVKAK